MSYTDRSATILDGWKEHLRREFEKDWSALPPEARPERVYASRRRDCVRAMCLDLLHPEDATWDHNGWERLQRGREREHSVISRLREVGQLARPRFEVTEQQQWFVIKDRDGTELISGKYDCRLKFEDNVGNGSAEIKSGMTFQRVIDASELDYNRWTKHAPDQLLTYGTWRGDEQVYLIIDKPGLPVILPFKVEDYLDRVERFYREARIAVDVRAGRRDLPEYCEDVSVCRTCEHLFKSCTPPKIQLGEGIELLDDEETEEACRVIVENAEAAKEHKKAKDWLRERARGKPWAMCGRYEITGKAGRKTTYDYPEEVKEKHRVVDPEGQWRMEVNRID